MVDFIIFGGTGIQGKICARDLLESGYSVALAGRDKGRVRGLLRNKKTSFIRVDLRNEKEIEKAIVKSKAEVVVNCAELTFNIPIMRACLKAKRSLTDLGGLHDITREQFKLNEKFKEKGIIGITGCGSTPGISNVLTAHVLEDYDSVDTIDLGFAWDSNVKEFVVPYSIKSIFDEFSSSPVVLYNGKFKKSDRMRCLGTFDFKAVGRQTCYCIVHSEVFTFARYFKKIGLKNVHYMAGFPKHSYDVIKMLMNLGFSSEKPEFIDGKMIKPIDFTIQTLKDIKAPKDYREVENIWVRIYGKKNGKEKKSEIDCIVKTLDNWKEAGSNVDTGRTISIISQMLLNGEIPEKGVYSPEKVVPHRAFIKELGKREMFVYLDGKRIN